MTTTFHSNPEGPMTAFQAHSATPTFTPNMYDAIRALLNSHAALVAALSEMVDAAKIQSDALLEQGLLGSPLLGAAMIKARAALAKAEA